MIPIDLMIRLIPSKGIFVASTILIHARERGLLPESQPRNDHLRYKVQLGRLATRFQFPENGDDLVMIPGQAPFPDWRGWRWHAALPNPSETFQDIEPDWSPEFIISLTAYFFLKDLVEPLSLDEPNLVQRAEALEQQGGNSLDQPGLGKPWDTWIVYMPVFSRFLQTSGGLGESSCC